VNCANKRTEIQLKRKGSNSTRKEKKSNQVSLDPLKVVVEAEKKKKKREKRKGEKVEKWRISQLLTDRPFGRIFLADRFFLDLQTAATLFFIFKQEYNYINYIIFIFYYR